MTNEARGWALSRYEAKSFFNKNPNVTLIKSEHEAIRGMFFGITEADDGPILIGTVGGAFRYDGNAISDFKGKEY